MRYSKIRFSRNATKKRQLERTFLEELKQRRICGNVIALTGPAYKEHIKNYELIVKKTNKKPRKIFIAEIHPKVYKSLCQDRVGNQQVSVHNKDFFDLIVSKDIRNIGLLDFDACATIDYYLKQYNLISRLQECLIRNRFNLSTGLSFTFTPRNSKTDPWVITTMIKQLFETYGYSSNYTIQTPYKDGQPMIKIDMICKRYKK